MPYETSTTMTYDEYKKMSLASYPVMHRGALIFLIAVELMCVILFVVSLLSSSRMSAIFLIYPFVLPVIFFIRTTLTLRKVYNSMKAAQNYTSRYLFYENHVEATTSIGESRIEYKNLYKVIETKTNYYLFIGMNQAMNIIKANCSDELILFMDIVKTQVNNTKK